MNPGSRKKLNIEDCVNQSCPNSGKPVSIDSLTLYNGYVVGFCNKDCRDEFENAVHIFEAAIQKRTTG